MSPHFEWSVSSAKLNNKICGCDNRAVPSKHTQILDVASMKKTRVVHMSSVHPPFDGRIFHKEAKTLVKAGYNVTLITQHDKEEIRNAIRIVPLPKAKTRFERMTKTVWILLRLALKEKADIYHLHDPELIILGLLLKLRGKKVVYDLHELVYFQIEDKSWMKSPFVRKLIQSIYLLFEKWCINLFDHFILAENGYKNYFQQMYRNFSKYTIIKNFPLIPLIEPVGAINKEIKQKPIVIYAGGLSKDRGIKEMVESMQYVKHRAEIWLLGEWESEEFNKECESLEGWKYTHYLGLFSLGEVYRHMELADIGISVLHPVENYLTSLPVKAFEYMTCTLPMIMSNFPYWKEIFADCALFVNPHDPKDIAEKILFLLDHPSYAEELGKKGKQLVLEKYNWDTEGKKLCRLYELLIDN